MNHIPSQTSIECIRNRGRSDCADKIERATEIADRIQVHSIPGLLKMIIGMMCELISDPAPASLDHELIKISSQCFYDDDGDPDIQWSRITYALYENGVATGAFVDYYGILGQLTSTFTQTPPSMTSPRSCDGSSLILPLADGCLHAAHDFENNTPVDIKIQLSDLIAQSPGIGSLEQILNVDVNGFPENTQNLLFTLPNSSSNSVRIRPSGSRDWSQGSGTVTDFCLIIPPGNGATISWSYYP